MSQENYFSDLAKIDVSNYIEKKGQFNYLSWVYAIDQLRRYDPTATWTVKKFKNIDGVELPYMQGPNGAWVEVEVTVKGHALSQIQPIMDFKNKSVQNPDAMDVNKAIQRCIVKGIALHGLGLYIYAGEDFPSDQISGPQSNKINELAEQFASMRKQTKEAVFAALGVASVAHLSSVQADVVIDKLSNWIHKAQEAAATPAPSAEESESQEE